MKPWHGMVVAVALLAIFAYLAMIVGPHFAFGRVTAPLHAKTRMIKTASSDYPSNTLKGAGLEIAYVSETTWHGTAVSNGAPTSFSVSNEC